MLCWLFATRAPTGAARVSANIAAGFPQTKQSTRKRTKRKPQVFYDQVLKGVPQHHFCRILFDARVSYVQCLSRCEY